MTAEARIPDRYRLGPDLVPKARYIDAEFLELELERLFPAVWQVACRLEEIPEVGNYVEVVIGDDSIAVVRTGPGEVAAYFNSCRHRGTRLVTGQGRIGEFRCPFHAWRWALDGSFRHRPDDAHFEPSAPEQLCLVRCSVDTWGGWVWINLDPDPEPLLDYLDPLPGRLEGFRLEDMRYVWHKRLVLPANWKTAIDAFIEAYHVPGTHPQFLRPHLTPSTPATLTETELSPPSLTEVHGRHGRVLKARPDPEQVAPLAAAMRKAGLDALDRQRIHVDYQLRELQALNTRWDRLALDRIRDLEVSDDPREQHLLYLRTRHALAREAGLEMPELTPDQVRAGAYDWHIFPNTVLLVTGNVGSVLGYRALPHGHNPDSCIFDVWSMELFAPGTEPDVQLEEVDGWSHGEVGEILSQDFDNMREVTVGMHSRSFQGLRLNTRQESTIRHHHEVADGYLFHQPTRMSPACT